MDKKRIAALAAAAWMACMPLESGMNAFRLAHAEGTVDEAEREATLTSEPTEETEATPTPEPTEEPEATPKPEPTEEPEATPTSEPTEEPEATPTPEPTEEPEATPTPMPTEEPEATSAPEEDDWKPHGEAWAILEDATKLDGRLQDILNELSGKEREDEEAEVFIRTRDMLVVSGIGEEIFDRVTLSPDEEVFDPEKAYYVEWQIQDAVPLSAEDERTLPPIVVYVTREGADKPNIGDATPAPTQSPEGTPAPTEAPTQSPEATPAPTDAPTQSPEATPAPTDAPTQSPEATPAPTETPETPAPTGVTIEVTADDYEPDVWTNHPPVFTLSGIPEGSDEYVYGVFVCNERLILLAKDTDSYVPTEEGLTSVRFAILDLMGDVVSLSDQYDLMLDMSAPDGPYLSGVDYCDTVCYIEASDSLSGLSDISYDEGETWEPYIEYEDGLSIVGEKGDTIEAGTIWVRDVAGNISANAEEFTFGKRKKTGGTGGTGTKPIKHVKETMDYSKANYNALELKFSDEPQTQLVAGETTLNLSLSEGAGDAAKPFTAKLAAWQTDEKAQDKPNALVLTAQAGEENSTWRFSGDVYKLLNNSGVDYLVFSTGEYMTALPTAGFTGGTQYGKLKASGVSTRKFEYTLCQDEALRETTLSVQVEGETYLLEEDTAQPMYRYDVLVGTTDLMKNPYESYKHKEADP